MVNLAGIKKGLSLVPSKREPQGPFSGQQRAQAVLGPQSPQWFYVESSARCFSQLDNKFAITFVSEKKKKASYSPTHSLFSQHAVLLSSVGTMLGRAGGPSLSYNDPAGYRRFRVIHLLKGKKR